MGLSPIENIPLPNNIGGSLQHEATDSPSANKEHFIGNVHANGVSGKSNFVSNNVPHFLNNNVVVLGKG